jgi:hypothetical protein
MKNLRGNIEVAANLSIIAVAILLCAVLVKSYLIPKAAVAPAPVQSSAAAPAEARTITQRGEQVRLAGVDWKTNGKTLLLALSTTCHFCTQSGPFYQRVAKEHGDARLIVLVPQVVEEGQAYLKRLGVGIADVRQVPFDDLGLHGTPTLVLVDSNGSVADAWVGALTPSKENDVISSLKEKSLGD